MSLWIKNGHLLDPANNRNEICDLYVKDGKVACVGSLSSDKMLDEDVTVIDAAGKYVMPGFVDLHVHLREPGFEYKETIKTGTAAMAKGGYVLGGEQSGHIILGEFAATGDGLLASVYLASTIKKTKLPLSVLSKVTRYPQINASFAVKNKSEVVRNKDLQNYVSAIKGELPEGRILIRESGTEEKIRLTVEAKDEEIMNNAFK